MVILYCVSFKRSQNHLLCAILFNLNGSLKCKMFARFNLYNSSMILSDSSLGPPCTVVVVAIFSKLFSVPCTY